MKKFCKIKFLGSGEPMAIKQFNTCFAFVDENNDCFLVDSGGGKAILERIKSENIAITQIKNIFLTHSHTDHILGALWLIRKIASVKEEYECNFYMSESVYNDFMTLCNICVLGHMKKAQNHIKFNIVNHLDTIQIGNNKITFFDTYTKKTPQLGCKIETEGVKIGFCGDIPLEKDNFTFLKNVDILIHEALCDSNSDEKYNVYNRGHVTSKDAGKTAQELNAKKLILIHKADDYINNDILKVDAMREYSGIVVTAEDGSDIKIN